MPCKSWPWLSALKTIEISLYNRQELPGIRAKCPQQDLQPSPSKRCSVWEWMRTLNFGSFAKCTWHGFMLHWQSGDAARGNIQQMRVEHSSLPQGIPAVLIFEPVPSTSKSYWSIWLSKRKDTLCVAIPDHLNLVFLKRYEELRQCNKSNSTGLVFQEPRAVLANSDCRRGSLRGKSRQKMIIRTGFEGQITSTDDYPVTQNYYLRKINLK